MMQYFPIFISTLMLCTASTETRRTILLSQLTTRRKNQYGSLSPLIPAQTQEFDLCSVLHSGESKGAAWEVKYCYHYKVCHLAYLPNSAQPCERTNRGNAVLVVLIGTRRWIHIFFDFSNNL